MPNRTETTYTQPAAITTRDPSRERGARAALFFRHLQRVEDAFHDLLTAAEVPHHVRHLLTLRRTLDTILDESPVDLPSVNAFGDNQGGPNT